MAETDLLVLGLAQDRRRVEANLLFSGASECFAVVVYVNHVRVHACYERCLHHCPVLRVQIYIPDIAATPSANKT